MSEIRDETERTQIVVCGERAYEVPVDVKNRIAELEAELAEANRELQESIDHGARMDEELSRVKAELAEENKRYEDYRVRSMDKIAWKQTCINELRAELKRKDEALEKYGRHSDGCRIIGWHRNPCTCGLEQALNRSDASEGGEG